MDNDLNWRQLTPFGIEVDLDLRETPSPARCEQLRQLLWRDGLLLFRRQTLTHEQQAERMSTFGPVLRSPDGIGYISNEESKGGDCERMSIEEHSM